MRPNFTTQPEQFDIVPRDIELVLLTSPKMRISGRRICMKMVESNLCQIKEVIVREHFSVRGGEE